MFTTIIIRPIFNLLVFIYAILPGHDVGLSIIIFTVVIRLLLWPLVKKQLTQAKAMRELQPEVRRIKKATKGNKQEESKLLMELYKEREISPLGSIFPLIIQLLVLIGLYSGLRRVSEDPRQIVSFAYPALQHLSWIHYLSGHIHQFHNSLFGLINLNRRAIGNGAIYWPAMILVIGSAVTQYFQSKQLMPTDSKARGLRAILRDAGKGQQADQSEMSAAIGRGTRFFLPGIVFLFTVTYPATLGLYWAVGGLVAFIQQAIVLREDTNKLEAAVDAKPSKNVAEIAEAEVVEAPQTPKTLPRPNSKKTSKSKAKRRKK